MDSLEFFCLREILRVDKMGVGKLRFFRKLV